MIRWPWFGVRRTVQTLSFPTHLEILPYLVWLSSFWQKLEPIGNRAFFLENGLAASKFLISRPLRPGKYQRAMVRWPWFGVRGKAHTLGFPTHIESMQYLVWLSYFWQKLDPNGNRVFPLKMASRRRNFWCPGHFGRKNISEKWSVYLHSRCVGKPRPGAFQHTKNFSHTTNT